MADGTQIYPKAQAPVTPQTAEYANQRAKRWQARYDEAMDMAELWKNRYVELRKELNELRDAVEKIETSTGKHKADPPWAHPDTMIGRISRKPPLASEWSSEHHDWVSNIEEERDG